MAEVLDQAPTSATTETDLVTAIQGVLADSHEPLTLSKLRAALPAAHRRLSLEELGEVLHRQVAAGVLYQFPKYRSAQDRFWDRPMPVHIAALLQEALAEQPLNLSELRRKLPAYVHDRIEPVLQEQLAQGRLYRHPRGKGRGRERFGAQPPHPRDYLKEELNGVFQRLEQLGFRQDQVRAAALELLHDEEWAPAPVVAKSSMPASSESIPTEQNNAAPATNEVHR